MQKRTLFVIDDHPIISYGISYLVQNSETFELNGFLTYVPPLEKIHSKIRGDIIIVDIFIGKTLGLELIKALKTKTNPPVVLVLSMVEDERIIKEVLALGVEGFFSKKEFLEKEDNFLKTLLEIDHWMTTGQAVEKLWVNKKWDFSNSDTIDWSILSPKEREVAKMIGQGYIAKEIGFSLAISTKTVYKHLENIKKKLACSNLKELTFKCYQDLSLMR